MKQTENQSTCSCGLPKAHKRGIRYRDHSDAELQRHFKHMEKDARTRKQTENQIQSAFFSALALLEKKHPEVSLCYAIPNGSYRKFTARMIAQATGLKSGVPDVHLPVARGIHVGLWIEFKSDKGRLSESQKAWAEKLTIHGHKVEVCRDWQEAVEIVKDYLNARAK